MLSKNIMIRNSLQVHNKNTLLKSRIQNEQAEE
jgi:hypothetical protein